MTEDQAKRKWCPMARAENSEEPTVSVNRSMATGGPDIDCMCLASACIMWQWTVINSANEDGTVTDGEGDCGLKRGAA